MIMQGTEMTETHHVVPKLLSKINLKNIFKEFKKCTLEKIKIGENMKKTEKTWVGK